MKIAFFDAKPYDVPSFSRYAEQSGITIKFLPPYKLYKTCKQTGLHTGPNIMVYVIKKEH